MPETSAYTSHLTTKVVNQENDVLSVRRIPRLAQLTIPLLLFLGSLAVYWMTRTHLNTFDAVAYANQMGLAAETGKLRPLFHPHHLLFNALCFSLWRLVRFCGYGGGPLLVTQTFNAVVGAGGITLYYLLLRRERPTGGGVLPLLLALGLAGSFGWWICATDGRVNMPSCVLMLIAFGALRRLREQPSTRRAALTGVLVGLALLFHESAGLFGIVGAVGILMAVRSPLTLNLGGTRKKNNTSHNSGSPDLGRGGLLTAYGAAWGAVVLVAYALVGVFALHLHSAGEFKHWMNAYAERGWWWDFRILQNLRLDLFGLRHAVFVQPLGRAALAQTSLEPFGTAALGLLWLLYGLALMGLAAAGCSIAAALPRLFRSDDRPVVVICLIWAGLYGTFFTVWCPGAFVFWVPVLMPLGMLLRLSLRRRTAWLLGVWIGVYGLLNFVSGIVPYLKPIAGISQRLAADIHSHTPRRSLIIVAGVGEDAQCEVDIPYFANRPILSLHGLLAHTATVPDAQAALAQSVSRAFGAHRPVYVLDEIWSRRDVARGLQRQSAGLSSDSLHMLFSAYPMTPAWTGPRGTVWRLSPPPAFSGRTLVPARRTEGETRGRVNDRKSGADGGGNKH